MKSHLVTLAQGFSLIVQIVYLSDVNELSLIIKRNLKRVSKLYDFTSFTSTKHIHQQYFESDSNMTLQGWCNCERSLHWSFMSWWWWKRPVSKFLFFFFFSLQMHHARHFQYCVGTYTCFYVMLTASTCKSLSKPSFCSPYTASFHSSRTTIQQHELKAIFTFAQSYSHARMHECFLQDRLP